MIGFVVLVFWHGFWAGAPRSDQIGYLHQVSEYTSLTDILHYAPDWNRTHAAGDSALYRPALYYLLGLEYSLFGYHFFFWQAFAITLHGFVALVLHATFWKTRLRDTWWPLAISCLFAASFLGSELVIWNHLTGYVFFCLMASVSLYSLISFLDDGRRKRAVSSISSAFIAAFTYELGVIYCVLVAMCLFWALRKHAQPEVNVPGFRRGLAALTIAFCVVPLIYAGLDVQDYRSTAGARGPDGLPASVTGNVGALLKYSAYQLVFWTEGWLTPISMKVSAYDRASLREIRRGWTVADISGYAGVILFGCGGLMLVISRRHCLKRAAWLRAALAILLLGAYSGIIAFGRSLDRGIGYTLTSNLYYAYIPMLGCCLAVGLLLLDSPRKELGLTSRSAQVGRLGSGMLASGMILLTILNGLCTYHLCRVYRSRSAVSLALIDRISDWRQHQGAEANAFFQVSEDCAPLNPPMPWFEAHLRRASRRSWTGPFSMADVLFPEKSFLLNKTWLRDAAKSIDLIPCPVEPITNVHILEGRWELPGASSACYIRRDNFRTVAVNENGQVVGAAVVQGRLATDWGVSGRLAEAGDVILWSNGTIWLRN